MKKTVITLCVFAITAAFGISNADYDKFIALDDSGRYKEALALIKPQAEAGDGRAAALVGYLNEVRFNNIGEGVRWYKKGMELNDSLAHSNMALIYYRMTDYKLAAKTYEKASQLGDTGADAMLGNMYLNGIYFKRDYKKALVYPISFCIDNSETVFELAKEFKHIADGLNFEFYDVVACPNDGEKFARFIANKAVE